MAWARLKKGEVIEVFDRVPPGALKLNGKTIQNSIFSRPEKLAEHGIYPVIDVEETPDPLRYNITKVNVVFNPQNGQIERSYQKVERPIEAARNALMAKIKPAYMAKLQEGFLYLGNRYDVDDRSVMFIDIESRAAETPEIAAVWPANYGWRDYDNQVVPMTASQLIDFSRAARIYRLQLQSKKWQHEAAIAELSSHDAINAYQLVF